MITNETSRQRSSAVLRLTRAVAEKSGLDLPHAKDAVDALSRALKELLLTENEAAVPFLGVLRLRPECVKEFLIEGITYRIATKKRAVFTPYAPFLRKLFTENKQVFSELEPIKNDTNTEDTEDNTDDDTHYVHLCPLPILLTARQRRGPSYSSFAPDHTTPAPEQESEP